jgi:uncharacterized membrane protein
MSAPQEPGPAAVDPRTETRVLLALWLATVVAAGITLALWIARSRPENLHYVWLTALALASVPGKLAIFSGLSPDSPLGPWGVAFLGVAVDLILSMSLSLGLGAFRRMPGVGRWLDDANRQAAMALAQYPRLKRMAFWGIAVFVALPLPGSGWVGGTFAAQLVGLTRPMGVAAIGVGGVIIGVAFALLAQAMGAEAEAILKSPWIAGAGLVVLALIVWVLWRRFRDHLKTS